MSPFLRAERTTKWGIIGNIHRVLYQWLFTLKTLKCLLHPGGIFCFTIFLFKFRTNFCLKSFPFVLSFEGLLTTCLSKEFRFFQIIRFSQSFRGFIGRIGLLNSRIIKIFKKLACSLFCQVLRNSSRCLCYEKVYENNATAARRSCAFLDEIFFVKKLFTRINKTAYIVPIDLYSLNILYNFCIFFKNFLLYSLLWLFDACNIIKAQYFVALEIARELLGNLKLRNKCKK